MTSCLNSKRYQLHKKSSQTCIQKRSRSHESSSSPKPNHGQLETLRPTRDNVNERRENGGREENHGGGCCGSSFEQARESNDGMFRDGCEHMQQGISGLQLLLYRGNRRHNSTDFLLYSTSLQ